MCNFKKGNKVVRVAGQHSLMKVGDVATVESANENGLKLVEFGGTHDDDNFVLYVNTTNKVTLDVCHRLVAYDCEIVKVQAQLDSLREKHQREVEQLEETLNILTSDMNALKSEYDVE